MFVNSGTRGNKIGLLRSLSVSPLPPSIKPGTRKGGLSREVPKKSFGISSWHLLRKGEKTATKRKNGKRILGLMTDEGGSAFLGKGCCENARVPGGKEKEDWKDFSKS